VDDKKAATATLEVSVCLSEAKVNVGENVLDATTSMAGKAKFDTMKVNGRLARVCACFKQTKWRTAKIATKAGLFTWISTFLHSLDDITLGQCGQLREGNAIAQLVTRVSDQGAVDIQNDNNALVDDETFCHLLQ